MIDCSSHLLCDYFDLRKSCWQGLIWLLSHHPAPLTKVWHYPGCAALSNLCLFLFVHMGVHKLWQPECQADRIQGLFRFANPIDGARSWVEKIRKHFVVLSQRNKPILWEGTKWWRIWICIVLLCFMHWAHVLIRMPYGIHRLCVYQVLLNGGTWTDASCTFLLPGAMPLHVMGCAQALCLSCWQELCIHEWWLKSFVCDYFDLRKWCWQGLIWLLSHHPTPLTKVCFYPGCAALSNLCTFDICSSDCA